MVPLTLPLVLIYAITFIAGETRYGDGTPRKQNKMRKTALRRFPQGRRGLPVSEFSAVPEAVMKNNDLHDPFWNQDSMNPMLNDQEPLDFSHGGSKLLAQPINPFTDRRPPVERTMLGDKFSRTHNKLMRKQLRKERQQRRKERKIIKEVRRQEKLLRKAAKSVNIGKSDRNILINRPMRSENLDKVHTLTMHNVFNERLPDTGKMGPHDDHNHGKTMVKVMDASHQPPPPKRRKGSMFRRLIQSLLLGGFGGMLLGK